MSDSWLVVIPSVNPQSAQECFDSLTDDDDVRWMPTIVDNTQDNHGVAGAWNIGIDQMYELNFDWLVICSESIRFGAKAARDLQHAMDYATGNTKVLEADNDIGWHLICFRKEVFDKVGYFDETFWPAYYEDNDFSYRYQKAYGITEKDYPIWEKVSIDCELLGKARGLAHVEPIDFVGLEKKYSDKWGGVSPNETYDYPYNNPLFNYRYAKRR